MFEDLMSGLGYIGDAIDKPGRAVRGMLSGDLGEGLAAIPFSDSMGLTDESNARSGKQMLQAWGIDPGEGLMGDAAGFGAEMATDPLSYLGVGLGARLGSKAGTAAMARGPRYATGIDDLERMAIEGGQAGLPIIEDLRNLPGSDRVLSEINPGSKFLGSGAEGIAVQSPAGNVNRIGLVPPTEPGRPIAQGVLPVSRTLDVPSGRAAWRSETMPFADNVGNADVLDPLEAGLDMTLESQGLAFGDRKAANLGTLGGKPVVTDPGAIDNIGFTGQFSPVTQAQDPSMLMNMLINLGGGDEAVRRAIDSGRQVDMRRQLGLLGGGAGATTGAFGRAGGSYGG